MSDPLDLSDDERQALIELIRRKVDEARYPLSPSLAPLRAILAGLHPRQRTELPPPLKA